MLVVFKTIAGQIINLDLQPNMSVDDIKAILLKNHSLDVDKLIHQGKVLAGPSLVSELDIKEGHQVIMMLKKVAAKPTPATPTPTPVQPAPVTPVPSTPVPAPQPVTPVSAQPATPTTPLTSTADMVVGPELQATIQQMCDMGFEREQCIRALRAAYNNPDRAMQYLLDGIPENLQHQPAPAAAAPASHPTPATPPAFAQLGQDDEEGEGEEGAWAGTPQQLADLERILMMIRQNPQATQAILQQVGQQRPDLLQVIAQNQGRISSLLESAEPAETVIHLSAADREAVDRLMQLGFTERQVLEAFLACDRDESLAANYLFENQGDDNN
eukprot:c780_g1_i1.p1 GENE.c780_g1_i1~~c780_g1_i1.p1  ORF type:complete len:341 (+),score=70.06 c780_g1_i1:42-1025(+)